ncbi:MAG: flagellar protein [Oscillospiraceae bacterium]|nr:flagellar protein [Oscillospiraceae bacterium]
MSDLLNKSGQIAAGRITPPKPPAIKGGAQGTNFRDMLSQRLAVSETRTRELTFSKHAQARVEQRGVELTPEDIERLGQAISLAEEKGINASLIYLGDTAFIVNIPSKVVVTVVDSEQPEPNVFTNIDGAVIL